MASERREIAEQLFQEGYNCAQSVFLAFEDLHGIDRETSAKLTSALGGGMGRMREVCGCVSGMFLALGMLSGGAKPDVNEETHQIKKKLYEETQALGARFVTANGSIICRELLGQTKNISTEGNEPETRTESYYKKRPCKKLCGDAAEILENYLSELR